VFARAFPLPLTTRFPYWNNCTPPQDTVEDLDAAVAVVGPEQRGDDGVCNREPMPHPMSAPRTRVRAVPIAMAIIIVAVAVLRGPLLAQENKPVPKGA
jgi:hypothetical protein